jgi:hypothetical protein
MQGALLQFTQFLVDFCLVPRPQIGLASPSVEFTRMVFRMRMSFSSDAPIFLIRLHSCNFEESIIGLTQEKNLACPVDLRVVVVPNLEILKLPWLVTTPGIKESKMSGKYEDAAT